MLWSIFIGLLVGGIAYVFIGFFYKSYRIEKLEMDNLRMRTALRSIRLEWIPGKLIYNPTYTFDSLKQLIDKALKEEE